MKVILTEDVKGTGNKGDLVDVNDGFARNFLLRLNKAKIATKTELNNFEQKKESEKYHEKQSFDKAKEKFEKINGSSITVKAKKGDGNKLFGSITSKAIADQITKDFFKVDKKDIKLSDPIKEVGVYTFELKLFKDLTAIVSANIEAE